MSGEYDCGACGLPNADHGDSGLCRDAAARLRARAERAEAELLAWAGPCACDEINARHCPRHNETPEQREAAFAAVVEERNALRTRAEAAEAERDLEAKLKGEALYQAELEALRAAKAEAERDALGNEAVDRLMLVSTLRADLAAAIAERDEARALKVPPTCDELDMAHMDAAVMRIERDIAYKTIARLNRRAQEAERLALRAMRAGLHEAEGMRALVVYWRREAKRRLAAPPVPINTDKPAATCRSTHHAGCACHEARRDALVAQLTAERGALYQALYQLTANAELVLSRYRTGALVEEAEDSGDSDGGDGCACHQASSRECPIHATG